MKHVFHIHSNVVYLVAKGVVEYHQLEKKDVIFLLDRNMTPILDDLINYTSYASPEFYSYKNPVKEWLYLFQFKRKVKQITDSQSYHAYVPQTKSKKLQLLIHNSRCKGFSILEEGTDSYLRKEKLREVYKSKEVKLKDRFFYLNMIRSSEFFEEGYDHAYGLNANSFPGYERKIVLDKVLQDSSCSEPILENKCILIIDAVSIYNQIKLETHIKAVKNMLDYFVDNGIREVYYKLHPAQINTEEEKIFDNLFQNYNPALTMKRMDDDVIVEHLIVRGKGLKFFINISSLGLYAQNYGHDIYSFANFVVEQESQFEKLMQLYTQNYVKKIQFLG